MEVEAKELQKKEQKKKEKENIEEDSDRDTDGEEKKADVSWGLPLIFVFEMFLKIRVSEI